MSRKGWLFLLAYLLTCGWGWLFLLAYLLTCGWGWLFLLAYLLTCGWVVYRAVMGYTPGSLLERLAG